MATAGTAYVKFLGDYSKLAAGAPAGMKGVASTIGAMSKKWLAPAMAVGIGAGLTKLGGDFQSAYKQIRVGTGETGRSLQGLQGDFKALLKTRPDSMKDVAAAITEVHQRTDLTGKPLQDMARQMLQLSKITGTDLNTNIEASTRLLGDWTVPAGEAQGALDKVFRASQETGVGFGDITTQMTKYGAPLRQLGFGFEDSAALVGKFGKEGVNTGLVMGSMRVALGRMAKAGEAPVETLGRTVDEIKNAGSAGEANAKALELFGSRAGPDMAAAIREGRFEVDDLVGTIANGKDTIDTAAGDTATFSGKWKTFQNALKVGFEPVATTFFEGLTDAMASAMPFLLGVADGIAQLTSNTQLFIPVLATLTAAWIAFLLPGPGWIALVVGAVVALGAALVTAYQKVQWFHDAVDAVGRFFRDTLWPILQDFAAWIMDTLVPALTPFAEAVFAFLVEPIRTVIEVFQKLVDGNWWGALGTLLTLPLRVFQKLGGYLLELGKLFLKALPPILRALGRVLAAIGSWIVGTLVPAVGRWFARAVPAAWHWLADAVPQLLAAAGRLLVRLGAWVVSTLLPAVGRFFGRAIPALWHWLQDAIPPLLAAAGRFLGRLLAWVAAGAVRLGAAMLGWVGKFLGWLVEASIRLPLKLAELALRLVAWVGVTAVKLGIAFVQFVPKALAWIADLIIQLPGKLYGIWTAISAWIVFKAVPWVARKALELGTAFLGWIGDVITNLPSTLAGIWDTMYAWITGLPALITEAASGIYDAFVGIGSSIITAIGEGLSAAVDFVGDVAKGIWDALWGFLKDHVFEPMADFHVNLPTPLPTIYPFDGLLDMLGIEGMAEGGLVGQARLALIGEAGPELVLPLNDPKRLAELVNQYLPGLVSPAAAGLAVAGAEGAAAGAPDTSGVDAWAKAVMARLVALRAELTAWSVATLALLDAWSARVALTFAALRLRLGALMVAITADVVAGFTLMSTRSVLVVTTMGNQVTAVLRSAGTTWAAVGTASGAGYVSALAAQLRTGTGTIGGIVATYATALANALNPILESIGAKKIRMAGGAVVRYADGGMESHVAQIAPAGAWRVWAEPETGGEAYIPLARSKRRRSRAIAAQTVARLGGSVGWYAGGGVTGNTQGLDARFLARLQRWSAAVGEVFHIGSGYRDIKAQERLYAAYLAGHGNLAAKPGSSMHNYGLAVDGPHWGGRNPGAYGLTYRVRGEPWHVEPIEAKSWRTGAPGDAFGFPPLPAPPAAAAGTLATVAGEAMRYAYDNAVSYVATALAAGGSTNATGPLATGPAVEVGRKMAAARGWTGAQWEALNQLWQHESGWNPLADNPGSSAYGIPQSLPGSKMASAGADWRTNAATQIAWGLGYIGQTYRTPLAAWQAWQSRSPHWYSHGGMAFAHARDFDQGGTLRPGANLVTNNTGADEHLVPAGGGAAVAITEAHFHSAVDYDAFLRKTAFMVKAGRL